MCIRDRDTETEPEAPSDTDGSSDSSGSSQGTYLGNFMLTAYCNCAQCCGTAGNATASGVMPSAGHTVAMAGVPFGTQLLINGTVYTVEDLGTPYGHVDIYFGSHEEALSFGLQYADVYLSLIHIYSRFHQKSGNIRRKFQVLQFSLSDLLKKFQEYQFLLPHRYLPEPHGQPEKGLLQIQEEEPWCGCKYGAGTRTRSFCADNLQQHEELPQFLWDDEHSRQ